jgi:hypothetical protein
MSLFKRLYYKYIFCRTKNSPPKKNIEEDPSRQRVRYMTILLFKGMCC